MTLSPLKFPPGIARVGSDGMQKGRWWNANLIRWRNGGLVPVGGWVRLTSSPLASPARKMLAWRSGLDIRYLVIGTDTQLLLFDQDKILDKTPAGFVPLPPINAGGGYGTGPHNYSTYSTPRDAGAFGPGGNPYARAPTWTIDTFGEDIMAVASSDGRLLHMSPNSTTTATFDALATPIANAPLNNRGVIVTEERHVMLFGAGGKPRGVAWCSREDFNNWTFTDPNNTAGFLELDCQGVFVNACKVRGGILLWTEKELWIARYVGLPAVYGFERVGQSCGLIGPNAFAAAAGSAIWAGSGAFWTYTNGTVQPVPCDVSDYFFRRALPESLSARMVGGANGTFPEAWFFFPEDIGTENTAYLVYNYLEHWWTIGKLGRSAIDGSGVWPTPLMAGTDQHIYQHETGWTAAGETRAGQVFIESAAQAGPANGDRIMHVVGAQLDNGTSYDCTTFSAFTRSTADDPVEYFEGPFTPYDDGWVECRFSGRDIRFRLEQVEDEPWTVGEMRLDVVPGGRR
jgi:hypothetical protein